MAGKEIKILPKGYINAIFYMEYIIFYNNDTYLNIYNYQNLEKAKIIEIDYFVKNIKYYKNDQFLLITDKDEVIIFTLKELNFEVVKILDIKSSDLKLDKDNFYYKSGDNKINCFNDNENKEYEFETDFNEFYVINDIFFLIKDNSIKIYVYLFEKFILIFSNEIKIKNLIKYNEEKLLFYNELGIFEFLKNENSYKLEKVFNLNDCIGFEILEKNLILAYNKNNISIYDMNTKKEINENNYENDIQKILFKNNLLFFIFENGNTLWDDQLFKSLFKKPKKIEIDELEEKEIEETHKNIVKKTVENNNMIIENDNVVFNKSIKSENFINDGNDDYEEEIENNIINNDEELNENNFNQTNRFIKKNKRILFPNYIPENMGIKCIFWNYLGNIVFYKNEEISTINIKFSDELNKQNIFIENKELYELGAISDEGYVLCSKGKKEDINEYEEDEDDIKNLALILIVSTEHGTEIKFNLEKNEIIRNITISNNWFSILLENNLIKIYDFGGNLINQFNSENDIEYLFSFESNLYFVKNDDYLKSYDLFYYNFFTRSIESKINLNFVTGYIEWIGVGSTGIIGIYDSNNNLFILYKDTFIKIGNYSNLYIIDINFDGILTIESNNYFEKPNPVSNSYPKKLYVLFNYMNNDIEKEIKILEIKEEILKQNLKNFFYLKDSNYSYSNSKKEFINNLDEENINTTSTELEFKKLNLIKQYIVNQQNEKAIYYCLNLKNKESFNIIYKLFEDAKLKKELKILKNLIENKGIIEIIKNQNIMSKSNIIVINNKNNFEEVHMKEEKYNNKRKIILSESNDENEEEENNMNGEDFLNELDDNLNNYNKKNKINNKKISNNLDDFILKNNNPKKKLNNLCEEFNNSNKSSLIKKKIHK